MFSILACTTHALVFPKHLAYFAGEAKYHQDCWRRCLSESELEMASQGYQQYQEDEYDPYLLRAPEDHLRHSSYGQAEETYIPSPVSPWHSSASPVTTNNQSNGSTVRDTQTPTGQHLKTEPTAVVHSCSSPTSRISTANPLSAGGWWQEIVSLVFSIACTAAMVIVLIEFDGKVLSSWAWYISPNAVVSILSTGSKAAMILPVGECISQLKWIYLDRHGQSPWYVLNYSSI